MTITIENTEHVIELTNNGATLPARVWQGRTAAGVPITVFVTRIAVNKGEDTSQFERELTETPPMRGDLTALFPHGIPLRLVL